MKSNAGEFEYKNNVLESVNHEEGRIVVNDHEEVYNNDCSLTDEFATSGCTATPALLPYETATTETWVETVVDIRRKSRMTIGVTCSM